MRRISILLFACSLFYLPVKGQASFSDYIPQPSTPEVASLIKYAEYPVSHYTGLVDISIPLYEIVAGEIRIPVTLSYHASGIKLHDEDGKIGLGWTLNAGPELGRIMKGRPDDAINGYINLKYGSSNTMFKDVKRSENNFYYRAATASTWSYFTNNINWVAQYDLMPDKFYYKLLNNSGAFYFQRDMAKDNLDPARIIIHPYQPDSIVHFQNSTSQTVQNFTVKDGEGFSYYFGENADGSQSAHDTHNLYQSGTARTAWKIMEIVSPVRKDKVTFSYYNPYKYEIQWPKGDYVATEEWTDLATNHYGRASRPFANRPLVSSSKNKTAFEIYPYDITMPHAYDYSSVFLCKTNQILNYGLEPHYITTQHESRVHTIETANETVEFIGGDYPSHPMLDSIVIKDKSSNAVIRSIVFYTSDFYFTGSYSTYEEKRKKLDAVHIRDAKGKTIEKYSFDYYGNGAIPSRYSYNYDHWGYYNAASNDGNYYDSYDITRFNSGVTSRTVSVHRLGTQLPIPVGNSNHEASTYINTINMGSLKSITYPTGRRTVFTYETHKYEYLGWIETTYDTTRIAASGLRISRIDEYEPDNEQTLTTIYKYGKNESGYGVPFCHITNDDYMVEKIFEEPTPHGAKNISIARIYNPYPAGQTVWESGSPVVYSQVTEYKMDRWAVWEIQNPYGSEICPAPENFRATNDGQLSWTGNAGAYDLIFSTTELDEVELAYSAGGMGRTTNTEYDAFFDAVENTINYVYIKSDCGGGSTSNWVGSKFFYQPQATSTTTPIAESGGTLKTTYSYDAPLSYHYNSGTYSTYTAFYDGKTLRTDLSKEFDDNWLYGQLRKKTEYRNIDENYLPARVTDYEYNVFYRNSITGTKVYQLINARDWRPSTNNNGHINMELLEARSCTENHYDYNIFTGTKKLQSETVSAYPSGGGSPVTKTVQYTYDNTKHLYPTQITKSTGDGSTKIEKMLYPLDANNPTTAETELINSHRWNTLLQKDITKGNAAWKTKFDYKIANDKVLLQNVWDGKPESLENRLQILAEDRYGNPVHIRKDDSENRVYLWGYNGQYPVAEIKNATYDQIKNILGQTVIDRVASANTPSSADLTAINNLRSNTNLLNAQITTYTYKPLVGMETMTDPRGVTTTYNYDNFGRLEAVKDENDKTIENYDYHYKD
jgi:YD repeat-containing protein